MTERERLIEMIGSKVCEDYSPNCDEWQPHSCEKCYANDCRIGNLADYLLASGVIVPPVKVGDTVYEFFDVKGFYSITELIVEDIVIGVNTDKCNLYCKSKQSNSEYIFHRDSFGKTVFFTREEAEEAEKALKEMKKND